MIKNKSQYGSLTVIAYLGKYPEVTKTRTYIRHAYLCECKCGNIKAIRGDSLLSGLSTSCGCCNGRKEMGKPEKLRREHYDWKSI